jgi:DNA-directed RNA polymerase specialized sigma24 family protein
VSTRTDEQTRALGGHWPQDGRPSWTRRDPAEEVALVAEARRELLLGAHGHRLGREDLEDCYGQATLELIVHARNHAAPSSRAHMANVLEQRFLSRVFDRRRALTGRSPMQAALYTAISLSGGAEGEIEIVDERADVERLAMLRFELGLLKRVAPALSNDQRLVLACQVGLQMTRGEFCRRYGWSPEKYRKVAQRARRRLRRLLAEAAGEPIRAEAAATEIEAVSAARKIFRLDCPPSGAMSE